MEMSCIVYRARSAEPHVSVPVMGALWLWGITTCNPRPIGARVDRSGYPFVRKSSYGITCQVQKMVAGERMESSAKEVSSSIFCQPVSGIGDLWFMHEMGQGSLAHV